MLDDLSQANPVGCRHATMQRLVSYTIHESDIACTTYILDDVAMITNEEEGTAVGKVELHSN
jgi:hypothetical protein